MRYINCMSSGRAAMQRETVSEDPQPSFCGYEEPILHWDYALEVVPPPLRSGTVEVELHKVTLSPPTVEDE